MARLPPQRAHRANRGWSRRCLYLWQRRRRNRLRPAPGRSSQPDRRPPRHRLRHRAASQRRTHRQMPDGALAWLPRFVHPPVKRLLALDYTHRRPRIFLLFVIPITLLSLQAIQRHRQLLPGPEIARLSYGPSMTTRDHGDPGDAPSVPPPILAIANDVRPSAAEEARTIAASTNSGTLATLTSTGDPWASFVTYGLLDGAPVLCVSNLAEHGRNLAGDPRASIAIVAPNSDPDPLASGRVTLAGVVERPTGDEACRRPRCAPGRRPRREVLHRLQRLLPVGAAGTPGAVGRRIRPDGFGDG